MTATKGAGAAVAVLGKGGTGKTTTAATLGALLAADGLQVELVDLDSTPSLTAWLDDRPAPAVTVVDVLEGRASVAEASVPTRGPGGLRLVPGDVELAGLEWSLDSTTVHRLVDELRARADVVLLDLRGGVASRLSAAAAAACDFAVVPVEASPAGLRSLKLTRELLDELGTRLAGVIPVRYNGRALVERQLVAALDAAGFPVWPAVRRDVAAAEASGSGEPLDSYAPRSRALEDYRAVCARLRDELKADR